MKESSHRHAAELPSTLWEAPDAIWSWSQSVLSQDEAETTPDGALYHYTKEVGLKGILSSERLWCFSHLHQTDRSEFAYSLDIAREVLQEVGRSDDWFEKHFSLCLLDIIDSNSFTDTFEFYLFSVSRHRDDPQQWSTFGDKRKGFALGFAPTLFRGDTKQLSPVASENAFVGKVLYGEEAIRARHAHVIGRAAKITSEFGHRHPQLVRQVKPSTYLSAMGKELLADQLIWNCLTGKHERYQGEQETRFVIMGMRERFNSLRKIFTEKNNEKNYVEHPLPLKAPNHIVEILVGPDAPADAEDRLKGYLTEIGYNYTIPIIRSASS